MSEQHVASGVSQEEEPQTPMWLPAVGAALFVGVALWWAVTPSAASSTSAEAAPSASAAASAAALAPNPQGTAVPQPRPALPTQQGAAPSGAASVRMPMPSALPAELQKRLNDLRGKQHP